MLRLAGSLAALSLAVMAAAPASAATIEVTIKQLVFSPAQISVKTGDTIEWVNQDFVAHTATARDKSFDVPIPANGKGSFTVTTAGSFDYYCKLHPTMKGQIEVTAP
ncbi:MAG TPA: cupredoxin family copper-binding protein [Stellaceae bacterium]|jgi:plastocyanin